MLPFFLLICFLIGPSLAVLQQPFMIGLASQKYENYEPFFFYSQQDKQDFIYAVCIKKKKHFSFSFFSFFFSFFFLLQYNALGGLNSFGFMSSGDCLFNVNFDGRSINLCNCPGSTEANQVVQIHQDGSATCFGYINSIGFLF